MTDSIWEDNRLAAGGGGNWFKFVADGDQIEGVLEDLSVKTFPGKDGKADSHCPVLTLDGTEVTASNVDLKDKLRAARPVVGDHVRIKRVTSVANKHGGRSVIFDVTVSKSVTAKATDEAPF